MIDWLPAWSESNTDMREWASSYSIVSNCCLCRTQHDWITLCFTRRATAVLCPLHVVGVHSRAVLTLKISSEWFSALSLWQITLQPSFTSFLTPALQSRSFSPSSSYALFICHSHSNNHSNSHRQICVVVLLHQQQNLKKSARKKNDGENGLQC